MGRNVSFREPLSQDLSTANTDSINTIPPIPLDLGEEDTDGTPKASSKSNIETVLFKTIENAENEFHRAIGTKNWIELDRLLGEVELKRAQSATKSTEPNGGEEDAPENDLYGLDDTGRAPLHLCCMNPTPEDLLFRTLSAAPHIAMVPDKTGCLPLHLAMSSGRDTRFVEKIIEFHNEALWTRDASGNTPITLGIEKARKRQQDLKMKVDEGPLWCFAIEPTKEQLQVELEKTWHQVEVLLGNRQKAKAPLCDHEQLFVKALFESAAPPTTVELAILMGEEALKKEENVQSSIISCICEQYPSTVLQKLIEACPQGLPKVQKDVSGRGIVALHYSMGSKLYDASWPDRLSFRARLDRSSKSELDDVPPPSYLEWWSKLKYLIRLWGSIADGAAFDGSDEKEEGERDDDMLLLHRALCNPDCPPSLIKILARMNPKAAAIIQPVSNALPIHLACKTWRYRQFPRHFDEKESPMGGVVQQLMIGSPKSTRRRYQDRLPLHHAIVAGKNSSFVSTLTAEDKESLLIRDPITRLYPYQLAAVDNFSMDMKHLVRRQFTTATWGTLNESQKERHLQRINDFYEMEQLTLIFEVLRDAPNAIRHEIAVNDKAQIQKVVLENVLAITQMKMVRSMYGLGNVAGHFIAWSYVNTENGWKTHPRNFAAIKMSIMDAFISTSMDKWWRKLKFWIWHDCPWDSIPRRDVYLLHGAVCNSDTSPWIIAMIVECFPKSASLSLPGTDCYPLHIACMTDRYIAMPWEFPNKRTSIELIARAYPEAICKKWKGQYPIHLALVNSKEFDEIKHMVDKEKRLMSTKDPSTGLFPFQLMAVDRAYTNRQKQRFERTVVKTIGSDAWKSLSVEEKVLQMASILQNHEARVIEGVWELLKRNTGVLTEVEGDDSIRSFVNSVRLSPPPPLPPNSPFNAGNRGRFVPQSSFRVSDLVEVGSPNQSMRRGPGTRNASFLSRDESFAQMSFRVTDLMDVRSPGQTRPTRSHAGRMPPIGSRLDMSRDESFAQMSFRVTDIVDDRSSRRPGSRSSGRSTLIGSRMNASIDDSLRLNDLMDDGSFRRPGSRSSGRSTVLGSRMGTPREESFAQMSFKVMDLVDDKSSHHRPMSKFMASKASLFGSHMNMSSDDSFALSDLQSVHRQTELNASHHKSSIGTLDTSNLSQASLNYLEDIFDREAIGNKAWKATDMGVLGRISEFSFDLSKMGTFDIESSTKSFASSSAVSLERIREEQDDGLDKEERGESVNAEANEKASSHKEKQSLNLDATSVIQEDELLEEELKSMFAHQDASGSMADTLDSGDSIESIAEVVQTTAAISEKPSVLLDEIEDGKATVIMPGNARRLQGLEGQVEDILIHQAAIESVGGSKKFEGKTDAAGEKDIVFVTNASVSIVSKENLLRASNNFHQFSENGWYCSFFEYGESISFVAARSLRLSREQTFVSSALIDGAPAYIDEDNKMHWVLLGKGSIQAIEKFDIDHVLKSTSSLLDEETNSWIDNYVSSDLQVFETEKQEYKKILDWLDQSLGRLKPKSRSKKFEITQPMLREAFAVQAEISSQSLIEIVTQISRRKLLFEVAKEKINTRYAKRKRIRVVSQLPRAGRFYRLRHSFIQSQKRSKLFKTLRRKQEGGHDTTIEMQSTNDSRQECEAASTETVNHTKGNDAIAHANLLEQQPKSAIKQQESSSVEHADRPDKSQDNAYDEATGEVRDRSDAGPSTENESDDSSLSSTEITELDDLKSLKMKGNGYNTSRLTELTLFEKWKEGARMNQKQRMTLKNFRAKRNVERTYRHEFQILLDQKEAGEAIDGNRLYFLELYARRLLGQQLRSGETDFLLKEQAKDEKKRAKVVNEDTDRRWGEHHYLTTVEEINQQARIPKSSKQPTDAFVNDVQTEEDQIQSSDKWSIEETVYGIHLRGMNQPTTMMEDDDQSLGATDLFDPPKSALATSSPLLAAAIKARDSMNQPKTIIEEDEKSLESMNAFYSPKGVLTTSKPLLAASIKARKQADQLETKRNVTLGEHLDGMNQPATIVEEDEESLDSMDVFDPPKRTLAKTKPLLAAAIKAREQADQLEREESAKTTRTATPGEHVDGMDQPQTIMEEDEECLESTDLFDSPKSGFAKSKPLLEATIKAREQAEKLERKEETEPGTLVNGPQVEEQRATWSIEETVYGFHLRDLNQPAMIAEDDEDSLGQMDLFDAPKSGLAKSKPLLAAAIKAREQVDKLTQEAQSKQSNVVSDTESKEPNGKWSIEETVYGFHLRDLNQPSMITEEDEDSLGSTDLFDAPKSGLAKSKPLLAAAIKAREQADQLEREEKTKPGKLVNESQSKESSRKWSIEETVYGFHLRDLNQPVVITEEDEDSLGSMDLFDAPKSGLAKSKPLLAAAIKAREQADQLEFEEQTNRNATLGEHLHGMNQPSTIAEEDEDSLGSMDLFDAPKSGLAKSKPLLAAAIKAREQADNFERAEPAKPMTTVEEDQESILESDSSSSSDSTSTTPDSPEKDAQAAAGADVFEDANLSPSTETTQLLPFIQLELANVPQSAYLMDADSSVDSSGASEERKEEVNRDVTLGEHLRHLNQPSMITEEDEDSLGSTDLFDAPKSGLAKSKPLLAAAIKAREQADQLEREQQTKPGKLVNESQSKEPSRKWSIEETVYGFHLRDLNQPVVITEEDEDSLGSTDLFDAPKSGLAKSKPLLAAAIKAREQADQLEFEEQTNRNATLGEHLHGMNQPSTIAEEDDDSLGSADLFDAPKSGLAKSKPLLAAAIKAREQADNFERAEPAKPMTTVEEDQESILESDSSSSSDSTSTTPDSPEKDAQAAAGADLFEDANLSPSTETTQLLPFIQLELANVPQSAYLMDADSSVDSSGASEERKEEVNRDVTLGEHLRHLNQPSMITEEDEDSLGSTDLFDAPKSGLAKSKPLLAAAIKAREQADQLEREQQTKPGKLVNESQSKEPSRKWSIEETVYGFHLRDLNQPVVITEEDEDSLGSTDLFDAPKSGLAKSKPLLAAAIKAREQADQLEFEEQTNRNATLGEHLHGMNQPSTIAEEDDDSLGSADLFDAPKSGLAKSKPLLAAAIKAREQADNFERAEPAKPMTTVEEDQESILESDSSSSSDSTSTTPDSPEKDAQAAAGADLFEDANLSPSTETTQLLPFIQLELANVPQSAYLMDADSSVDSSGASEERKEEVNRDVTLGEHLRHLNQPSMITEEDEDSLGSTDLFDAPKSGLAKSKPLLAAAIKAREQADQLEREQQTKPGKLVNESQSKEPSRKWSIEETVYGFHLRDLNQPVVITEEDEDSLGSMDLFDAPKSGLAKSKPLLAAAIKAREQADQLELEEQTNRNATLGEHLHGMNQPSTIAEEDEDSLGSMDLFDAPKSGLANSKPLLAAAIKAREQADNFERAEPAKPMTTVEEDQESILESDSSSSSDSTPTTSDSPEKDAQAAAGADVFEDANLSPSTETTQLLPFIQLELANVPQSAYLMDADSSVDSSGASEERKEEVNRDVTLGEHLRHLNQPSMITEEDEDSLGSTDLFDAPKSGLAKSKPLLAAAIKAREQADQLEREQQTKPGKLVNESQSKEPSRKWSIEETVYGFHLRDLNQPVVITEEDEDSLGSMDLFDAPKSGLAKSKPLLAAAIKAREQADQLELEEQTNRNATLGEHLHGMNQPSTIAEEDEDSLGSMDLFDAPKSGLANSKPLLAAAIKAREQADNFERAEPAKPMTIVEEDQESILESDSSSSSDPTSTTPNSPEKDAQAAAGADVFEDANLSPSTETTQLLPFIQLELANVPQSAYLMDADSTVDSSGASGERKEEVNRDVTLGEHLRHLNQPSMITEEDEDSLGSTDLFDAPKSGLANSKPLLAAAIKAREQADQLEREQQTKPGKLVNESQSKEPSRKWSIEETVYGFHLRDLNQPVVITEEDEDSLGSMDLFDAPKSGLAKSKPLLAAAIKAREQADQKELEEQTNRNATLGEHLHGMNQPSTIAEEDEDSLGSMDLFDAPKSGLANSKPLLAAAIKAREQADNFERAEPAKPMTTVEEDQESILESDSSSSSDSTPTTSDSPEKDAQAAAGADVFEDANLSPSTETTQLLPFIQLELANVPQSAYLMDADSSVDSSGASEERKEEVNRDVTLGEHLRHLNQPSMITEEDEDSLGSTDLFDAPKSGLAKSKPLLAAAIKAREQADQLEREQQTKPGKLVNESQSKEPSRKWSIEETVYGFHLRDLNQPVVITEEDEDSLGSMDLFDAPKSGLAKSKPLLAAAIKAREQADQKELEEQTNRNATLGEHLHGMNQPSTIAEEDEDSLGSMDLFDAPKSGLANSKPLLAAAIKAREQADNFERAEPAKPMTTVEEDQESILESDSSSSSDSTPTTSDSPEKDAQAAAGADVFEDANLSPSTETTQLLPFIQLELANVPQSAYLMDADSSVDSSGASEERKEEVNRDVTLGEHLRHLNQPSMITEEDEDSLGSTDLFDAPKSGLAKSKPLLAAAIKAREQADQLEREEKTKPGKLVNGSQSKEPSRKWSIEETVYGFHLRDLNQPVVITEEDEDSLGSMDLFDAPKSGLAKSKPLLAAAIKAREQADQKELEEQTNRNATLGEHLHGMNQPSTIAEEDEDSLGSMDLFDAPKSGLANSKPLLAAAIKAREQADNFERAEPAKPMTTVEEDQESILESDSSSSSDSTPTTSDSPEKDAQAAAGADVFEDANLSPSTETTQLLPFIQLELANVPQSAYLMDADSSVDSSGASEERKEEVNRDVTLGEHLRHLNQPSMITEEDEDSLGSTDLFDAPKSGLAKSKPLLAAAIKAREQADQLEREEKTKPGKLVNESQSKEPSRKWSIEETVYGFHLRDLNQPVVITEEDEDSLGSTDLFDAPKSVLAKSKPLLAAAIKAREQADQLELEEQTNRNATLGEHLHGMNQPSTIAEEDEDSLGSMDLFDAPKSGFAKSKPLLAAAIKARKQSDQLELEEQTKRNMTLRDHLHGMNQPFTIAEKDEDSLGSADLSDSLKSGLAMSKPLLAVAVKDREQADQLELEGETQPTGNFGVHLDRFNQPTTVVEDEEESLGSNVLFDPPKSALTNSKPLLAAAIKAREQLDDQPGEIQIKIVSIDEQKSSDSAKKITNPIEGEGKDLSESSLEKNTSGNSGLDSAEYLSTVVNTVPNGRNDGSSLDDSSLSTGELDELEYLFQVMEEGDEYDKKRLYDLDLIAKSEAGMELDQDEKMDLAIIMQNRRKERAYRNEFRVLLDKKEKGKEVDESRLLFLELFARRHLGESLSEDELGYLMAVEEEAMLLEN